MNIPTEVSFATLPVIAIATVVSVMVMLALGHVLISLFHMRSKG